MGTGDDTVDTGAGSDFIINADYDDDDVVNGGAGSDALSAVALATGAAAAAAQVQAEDRFIAMTPGATRTSTPQITGVESVYLQVVVDDDNDEGTAATNETVDFTSTSGITNLYLEIDDDDTDAGGEQGKLTLSEVDAAAIHLLDRATDDDLGELVIAGTGQASLTLKGFDFDGGTDLTISDVDAVTLTSYQSSSSLAVGVTAYGDVEADDSDTVTATMGGTTAALSGSSLTINSLSADGATAINLNAGSFNTLAITGSVSSTSESLDTMAIEVSDDGTLTVGGDIENTGAEMTSATITIGIAGSLTVTDQIDLASVEDVTVTVGAAGTFDINDFVAGGDVVINATMGSSVTVDIYGESGIAGTFDINGRGTHVAAFAIDGDTTVNMSGWTDTVAGGFTVTTNGNDDMTYVSNNDDQTVTTGNGTNSITTGSGADDITGGTGADTISAGAGNDSIDAGAGADTLTGGAGNDTFTVDTGDTGITLATADTITDFTTADDTIATNLVAGNATIADGSGLAAAADSGLAAFIAAADAVLTAGAGVDDAYIAYDVAGTGNAYVIIDEDDSGSVDAGDTLIILTGVNTAAEIAVADIG
jgi:hypothetical protein